MSADRRDMAALPRAFFAGPADTPDAYELLGAVASGAEGVLYRAVQCNGREGLPVAVKMLQPGHIDEMGSWQRRWFTQAELLASVLHPGLVRVRTVFNGALPHPPGHADGRDVGLYLVMDWIDGEPFDRWVRRQGPDVPAEALLASLLQVAAALDLLHSGRATRGVPVVHRDVKPANVVVTANGSVLVDVGATRGIAGGQRISGVVGTEGYIAPEVLERGEWSTAADRYALGAVAYFAITGTEPPPHATHDELRAGLEASPRAAGRDELVEHVLAALDPDPARRPALLSNWVAQLRRSSLVTPPPLLPPLRLNRGPGRTRRRHRGVAAVAAAAAVTGAGVVAVRVGGSDGRRVDAASVKLENETVDVELRELGDDQIAREQLRVEVRVGARRAALVLRPDAGSVSSARVAGVGDLDADGQPEVAVAHAFGNSSFRVALLTLLDDGTLRDHTATTPLGAGWFIDASSLYIGGGVRCPGDGRIVTHELRRASRRNPWRDTVTTYALHGARLRRVSVGVEQPATADDRIGVDCPTLRLDPASPPGGRA